MKKIFCLILFAFMLLTTGCIKAKNEIKTENQLINAIEQFQYDKQEVKLYAISNYIVETEFLGYQGTHALLQGFYSGILHERPNLFGKLYHYYGEIHFLRLLQLTEQFYQTMEDILDEKQKVYPDGSEFIDTLWGYFYATGDKRVIHTLCRIQKNDYNHTIKNKVKMSLERNQKTYPEFKMKCN